MSKWNLILWAVVVLMCSACAGGAVFAEGNGYSFIEGHWHPESWIRVKSPRWDHLGGWVQREGCIENETPVGATPKELLGKLAGKTYSSMVLKEKVSGDVTVSVDLEFSDRMAPLIVIAPELGKDEKGVPEYREHFEIVIFDKGVNVWHHFFEEDKPSWGKALYSRFPLNSDTRYTLEVKLSCTSKGKKMAVLVDGHEVGYIDNSLPDEFYVGITGCEGINRFYNFSITGDKR